ncbi:MAG: glutamine amidotransferase [Mycobacteriales bacterium]
MSLTIVSVYPELLGTYGDVGNVQVLEKRLAWRGIPAEVVIVPVREPLPSSADLYVLGGSEDDNQARAMEGLIASPLERAVAGGAHVFGVCAGLQLLGAAMTDLHGVQRSGLGLLDVATRRLPHRVLGEVVADFDEGMALPALTGFANHGGGTTLGPQARPLATTRVGQGNDGTERAPEGAVQGNVVATYLHGPVLARNPAFADWILQRVLGQELLPLAADPSVALHDERVRRARS